MALFNKDTKTAPKTEELYPHATGAENATAPISTSEKAIPKNRKLKKRVTLKQIKIATDKLYCFTFLEPIYQGEPEIAPKKDKDGNPIIKNARKEPPYLAQVCDEDTGEIGVIVVPTVLRMELNKNYENNDYVNRSFEIIQHRIQGKEYNTFEITEVEIEKAA